MVNPYRGEAELIVDGKLYVMRLPLGILAELESELKVGSLTDLVKRFETGEYSARDLLALLRAGLKGGGSEVEPDVDGGPIVAARAAAKLLAVTFTVPE